RRAMSSFVHAPSSAVACPLLPASRTAEPVSSQPPQDPPMNAQVDRSPAPWLSRLFTSDPAHHDGVRPFHIGVLRVLYVLMFVGVGIPVWGVILNHKGRWDHVRAVAFCVWAAY